MQAQTKYTVLPMAVEITSRPKIAYDYLQDGI